MLMPSWCAAGYVPQDRPGASGYFTPRSSAVYANECFNQADCTQRNPVLSKLQGELHRNPFRHRSHRKLHHVQVSYEAMPLVCFSAYQGMRACMRGSCSAAAFSLSN